MVCEFVVWEVVGVFIGVCDEVYRKRGGMRELVKTT